MKNLMTFSILTLLFTLISLSLNAQNSSKFELLKSLAGEWEGEATVISREGNMKLHQVENVKLMLDGNIATIHGRGFDQTTDSLVFEAYAVAHWDESTQQYSMNAHTREGRDTVAKMKLEEGLLEWWFDLPNGGTVKYIIHFTETTWEESGSYSPDGAKWFSTIKMSLKKI